MPDHHHRSGGLKQSNKRNKRSKASKRSLSRAAGGKVAAASRHNLKSSSLARASTKADRRHAQLQKRQASRQALLDKKRGVGSGAHVTPRIVGIVSLGASATTEQAVLQFLLQGADKVVNHSGNGSNCTVKYNVHKKDGMLTYMTTSIADSDNDDDDAAVMAALDLVRICHAVLFVMDGDAPEEAPLVGMDIGENASVSTKNTTSTLKNWDHLISECGDRILAACKAQGLATPITVLAHTLEDDVMTMHSVKSVKRSALKRRLELKKYASRFATSEFGPDSKVVEIDLTVLQDESVATRQAAAAPLVRTLCSMSLSPPKWVADAPRSYLVADQVEYDSDSHQLALVGFVRGSVPFDVNALLHIPQAGTFCVKHVQKAVHPFHHKGIMQVEEKDALWSDPQKRESLVKFATPDALEGEQNLIGFDEDMEYNDDKEEEEEEQGVARPAGWSDYQSAWLDAMGENDEGDDFDHGELAKALNTKSSSASKADIAMEDLEVTQEERKALEEQRRKDLKENLEFPDEVEIQEDVKASDRFARYRSLKSFRKSYWDPKENLPDSYASIYHFSSFKATQRDVMADMKDVIKEAAGANGDFWGSSTAPKKNQYASMEEDSEEEENLLDGCIPSGSYVTVTVEKISPDDYARVSNCSLVTAVTLLPHENKVSVLHMGLCQSSKCDRPAVPVKSKDVLTFRCGWRTWKARPVFSQNNLNSDKHKFERFLPQGGAFFAASIFGPVTYTPCPVLVFRESETDGRELIAIGSMLGADADRIVVKRIVLTGYPVRVHKRHATVKYMFYNPDDVNWFKPAGLTTKHGLHGNIMESVGEHGTMKCLFNAPIKQHDTVCLPLYKRMYPKFAPEEESTHDNGTVEKPGLIVL